jgi:Reprolysin family propeptide.
MKRKSILLEGTKTTVGEADRRILDNYLTNYEIHEFPRNGTAYSLTDEDGFDIEIELFGQRYQLEVYPNELRTDDFQVAIDGKPVPAEARSPCSTFKGNVQGTDRAVRLSIDEYGISGFIQLEDQKLYITKSMKFKLPGSRPTLFVAYYEKESMTAATSIAG